MHIYLFLYVAFFHKSSFIFSSNEHCSGAGNAIIWCIFLFLFHSESVQFQSTMTSTIVEYQNIIVFQLHFIFISLLRLAWNTEFENLNTIELLIVKQQYLELWSNFSAYLSPKSGTINLRALSEVLRTWNSVAVEVQTEIA